MTEFVKLEMHRADYGDALHVHYGNEEERHHFWIDGGLSKSFTGGWKKRVRRLGEEGERIDLLLVTHIDNDHIAGVRKFVEANRKGRQPPALVPVEEVWFNQYRHIRPYGEGALVARGLSSPISEVHWKTPEQFVTEVSSLSPRVAYLAARLARSSPAANREAVARGVAEAMELEDLLSGHYASNARFGDKAIVCAEEAPLEPIVLPGGAQAWILSPTTAGLSKLHREWADYLEEQNLAPLLSSAVAVGRGDMLAPALMQELMLRRRAAFEAVSRASIADLVLPIEELAARDFDEDNSVANGSSIAILFEYGCRRLLLAGDAYPSVMAASLRRMGYTPERPLHVDAWKLSHHGSRANTSPELLDLVRCQRYLVSTNGVRFSHPDKECLARVIMTNQGRQETVFYLNYKTTAAASALDRAADRKRYGYRLEYLAEAQDLSL